MSDNLELNLKAHKIFFVGGEDYIVIDAYRKLDPTTYIDIYDDVFLKRYTTALIKRQWGTNLSKFEGVALLGGVTMNGGTIYSQADEEIRRLEEEIKLAYDVMPMMAIG